jgi:RNA polymerase sigma-70 factor (ECF subfamily)
VPVCAPNRAPPTGAALETALEGAVARARAAWPELPLAVEAYLPYLAVRMADPGDLDHLNATDLYAACAAVHKDPRALAAIEARYFGDIDAALRKMNLASPRIDDVKQTVRRQLFVGEDGQPPRIAQYGGKGELRAWLRVTAVRAALKVIRKEKRETVASSDDAIFEHGTSNADPELAYIKEVYRDKFRAAFQNALDALGDRDKTFLRQHVVDGLSIDDLAALNQIHRATAARWLAKAKETLLEGTRKTFMQNARISRGECDSILRMVQSQLDATIRRRLESA